MYSDVSNSLKVSSSNGNIVAPQRRAGVMSPISPTKPITKGGTVPELSGRQLAKGLGVAALLLAGTLMVKPLNARIINKIEAHYSELEKNLPEVQKQFQEIFLRDDITLDETREMLKRYKAIEKIGVTGNKAEYITALFNEAKRNFGFENSNIDLKIVSKEGRYGGGSANYMPFIEVNRNAAGGHRRIMDVIHHEFRHKKQRYVAANYSIDELQRAEGVAAYCHAKERGYDVGNVEQYVDCWMKQKDFIKELRDELLYMFNIKDFDKSRVPSSQYDFAKNVIKSCEHREDGLNGNYKVYRSELNEVDAWDIGEKSAKLLSVYN